MQMFDGEVATLIKTDGTVEQKHWLSEGTFQSEAIQFACADFVRAE